MPAAHNRIDTDQLHLTAPTDADLDELHALFSDPAVWEHLPTGRHRTSDQTVDLVARNTASWRDHHLGAWVIRPREHPHGPLLGLAGCTHHRGPSWNLSYRLARTAWGHGYATEVSRAALTAAVDTDPALPVIAYLLDHNTASKRTAERAGLHLRWRGPATENPTATRLIYADRPLTADTVRALTATPRGSLPTPDVTTVRAAEP